jgi:PhzF family phenazine biosynthesis protein
VRVQLPIYQVDAFTGRVFSGNPAAVVPLDAWLPDPVLQAIAAENNLSETAFFVPEADGLRLRWFTPATEVDLCGHATLASAWVLFEKLGVLGERIEFMTCSGPISVGRDGDLVVLDFPSRPPKRRIAPDGLAAALGAEPKEVLAARDLVCVFADEAEIRALQPRMPALARLDVHAVCVTAPGEDRDFVSRFFAPRLGVPEDPVTGSAHCSLVPYWAKRLGKAELTARQVSQRGGELFCRDAGERVHIAGRAVLYLEGRISL